MNSDQIDIELMSEEDLPKVAEIFREAFNEVGENWTLEISNQHIKTNFFGDCHFIASLDGEIVGFLMAIPLVSEKGSALFVDSIAVSPGHQNKGIGQILWDKMIERGKKDGFQTIRLLANPKLKSFSWYKEMNFEESGWIELYKSLK